MSLARLTFVILLSGSATAHASPYYNPANPASDSGFTNAHELYLTIGCPGRGLLDAPCAAPPPPAKPRPLPAPEPLVPRAAPVVPAPVDSDGDGVVDRLDQCPGTPPGRTVDARGCELDSDGDGVTDDKDRCPGTPRGTKVDAFGCELDSDGDGVIDALDQCPNTPRGDRVDARGCTLAGAFVLRGVNFDNDSAELSAEARATLDEAVATLKRYPNLKVEIAGHTDRRSTPEYNQALSERRAQAVLDYFVHQGIPAANLSAKGYGQMQPIAENYSEAGRARNRRVELRILN